MAGQDNDARSTRTRPLCFAADGVAEAALRAERAAEAGSRCDACDEAIEGEPAGRGLYLWSRGDELRIEEPPLCMKCATAIGMTALSMWNVEEDEG